MKPVASVFSPAYPAAVLLYGMVFVFAAVHFMAIAWSRPVTVAFYAVVLAWTLALAWQARQHLSPITTLDMLFSGFVLLVLASLALEGGLHGTGRQYAHYCPS